MSRTPATVSLVMPMYNEAGDIGDVLASLDAQSYDHSALHLIVVDGGSVDGSVDLVTSWLSRGDIAGEIAVNSRRTIPTSLNVGIARARPEDIIIRLDAHTIYEPDYIASIIGAFAMLPATVGCVGGATLPQPETSFWRALVVALYSNPLGLGGAEYRKLSAPRLTRNVYLGAWRPDVLQCLGGYDERWEANEDGELAARLRSQGWDMYLLPLQAAYRVKRTPLDVIRLWGRYGFWRAQTIRRHPGELRPRHLIPPVAFGIALVLMMTPFRAVVGVLYAMYCVAIFARRSAHESPAVTMASCVFFPIAQGAWSLGLLRGLLDPRGVGATTKWPDSLQTMPLEVSSVV